MENLLMEMKDFRSNVFSLKKVFQKSQDDRNAANRVKLTESMLEDRKLTLYNILMH